MLIKYWDDKYSMGHMALFRIDKKKNLHVHPFQYNSSFVGTNIVGNSPALCLQQEKYVTSFITGIALTTYIAGFFICSHISLPHPSFISLQTPCANPILSQCLLLHGIHSFLFPC